MSALPPPIERRFDARVVVAVVLSACVHLLGSAWAASTEVLAARAHGGLAAALHLADPTMDVELPAAVPPPTLGPTTGGGARAEASGAPPVERATLGGSRVARPDVERAGRGGTAEATSPALNLADSDDGDHQSPELLSRFDRAQAFRNGRKSERRSPEDWSATRWRPTLLTFEATGDGAREETRPRATFDPPAGAWAGAHTEREHLGPGVRVPGIAVVPEGDRTARAPRGGAERGDGTERAGERTVAGAGVHDRPEAPRPRAAADTAAGVPMIAHADDASPALVRGPASDTLQSDQESMSRRTAIVQASGPGGLPGAGVGGAAAPGAPGFGGTSGPGSTSRALGSGLGGVGNVDPLGALRSGYLRGVTARIRPLWRDAFPRWAVLAGLGGSAIVSFVILPDGSIGGAGITRPSGVPEFDENCRQAVLRAGPFERLPAELGPVLHWSMTFTAKNTAVLPPHALVD
ncbi:MAG: TonB C-terminal domain-containing protein [Myxococcales bacterium]|nr:TonB C-terminal domain-containing protein [Myxococcales bacterium]